MVVCYGAAGHSSLVRLTEVPTGDAQCSAGETKVESGLDENDDGILQNSEVDAASTTYICNGATGAAGESGDTGANGTPDASTRLRTMPLPAGDATCPGGGHIIEAWLDLVDDGELDDDERDSVATTYICSGIDATVAPGEVYEGNIFVRLALELRALEGCEAIAGDLHIVAIHELDLSALCSWMRIEGDLEISPLQPTT